MSIGAVKNIIVGFATVHKADIAIGFGMSNLAIGTVEACKATLEVSDIIKEVKEDIEASRDPEVIRICKEKHGLTDHQITMGLLTSYLKNGCKIAKCYAPAIGLGVLGVASILYGVNVIKKENLMLVAACEGLDRSYSTLKTRTAKRFGEEVAEELEKGIEKKSVPIEEIDEDGNKKIVKQKVPVYDVDSNPYFDFRCFAFDKEHFPLAYSECYDENLAFLKAQETYWNNLLHSRSASKGADGVVYANEILKSLGMPGDMLPPEGQVIGWRDNMYYDGPNNDGFIDFGITDNAYISSDREYNVGGNGKPRFKVHDPVILVSPNYDGVVIDKHMLD